MNEARVGAWPTPGLHGEYSRGTGTQVQPFLSIHHVGGAIKSYFTLKKNFSKISDTEYYSWGLQRSETRVFVRRGKLVYRRCIRQAYNICTKLYLFNKNFKMNVFSKIFMSSTFFTRSRSLYANTQSSCPWLGPPSSGNVGAWET